MMAYITSKKSTSFIRRKPEITSNYRYNYTRYKDNKHKNVKSK